MVGGVQILRHVFIGDVHRRIDRNDDGVGSAGSRDYHIIRGHIKLSSANSKARRNAPVGYSVATLDVLVSDGDWLIVYIFFNSANCIPIHSISYRVLGRCYVLVCPAAGDIQVVGDVAVSLIPAAECPRANDVAIGVQFVYGLAVKYVAHRIRLIVYIFCAISRHILGVDSSRSAGIPFVGDGVLGRCYILVCPAAGDGNIVGYGEVTTLIPAAECPLAVHIAVGILVVDSCSTGEGLIYCERPTILHVACSSGNRLYISFAGRLSCPAICYIIIRQSACYGGDVEIQRTRVAISQHSSAVGRGTAGSTDYCVIKICTRINGNVISQGIGLYFITGFVCTFYWPSFTQIPSEGLVGE